ncbi:hypothetical protein NBRC10513_001444 [Rhodotorula toruloides]
MTTRLFQHYLLHGPTKYLHARPEELQHLEDLVECGSFVPTRREDDEIPPIPSGVKISRELREKSGRLVGQATYSSRTEAERAKRMFDGARVLGRVAETPLLCIDLDMQRDIASWRERVMPQS